jgi:L-asparagine oxygenase
MRPFFTFSNGERDELYTVLETVEKSPYADYHGFSSAVRDIMDRELAPTALIKVAEQIKTEREKGTSSTHVLRNCPRDRDLPQLGNDDPHAVKLARKKTFIGEAFLELFAQLTQTPLLSYATRFNGDFFTDVIAINKYRGKQTGYSDGDLVFHNDRTAHPVRADYISLLGMRCPIAEIVYTCLVEGQSLRAGIPAESRRVLTEPHFVTPFDIVSRDNNRSLTVSEKHPILVGTNGIRYLDTHTTIAPDAPPAAKDALLALKDALTRAVKKRHRILAGDLLTFANQNGLHSREIVERNDPELARSRWLLKTYAFRDRATADRHAGRWVDGVAGMVGD